MLGTYIERMFTKRYHAPTRDQIKAEVEANHSSFGRGVARRFTRGSVSIQSDRFLTKEDLQARHGSDRRR